MTYLCPVCGEPLKNTPDIWGGTDSGGRVWPVMGCPEDGFFGLRDDGTTVLVEPLVESDF